MKIRTMVVASVMTLSFAGYGVAQEMGGQKMGGQEMGGKMGGMMSPLMPAEKVEAMNKMMMEMKPDTLEASLQRGEMLFKDSTLGNNSTGTSCATCHPKGGSSGGAADMEWKGQAMKVAIPTLVGAAASFPKPVGPMKVTSTVGGQNNMCIMTFLKGTPLDLNSQEAVDLEAYVYSLSTGKKIDMGAKKILLKPVPGSM